MHTRCRQYLREAEDRGDAFALLDSIPYMPDFSEYNRNNYKFLRWHARYLLGKNIPSYSLDLARYFEKKGKKHKAAWAYFYAGKMLYQKKDYRNASVYLSEAEDQEVDLKDNTLLFQVYYYIGELYFRQHDHMASTAANKKAIHYSGNLTARNYLAYKNG